MDTIVRLESIYIENFKNVKCGQLYFANNNLTVLLRWILTYSNSTLPAVRTESHPRCISRCHH